MRHPEANQRIDGSRITDRIVQGLRDLAVLVGGLPRSIERGSNDILLASFRGGASALGKPRRTGRLAALFTS
jgi:hypothetical protein